MNQTANPALANLLLLPGKDLAAAAQRWPKLQKLLEDIVHRSRGEITLPVIGERVIHGMMQLWLVLGKEADKYPLQAVCLTEIQVTAAGQRRCWIWAYDGHGGIPLEHLEAVERWAQDVQKCQKICMKARRGIAHLLKGYKTTGVFLERNLHPVVEAQDGRRRDDQQHNGANQPIQSVGVSGPVHEHGAEQRADIIRRGGTPAIHGPSGRIVH